MHNILTDRTIQSAKPKAGDYKLADGDSLYLLVRPTGSKLWQLYYRFAGKQRKLSFGAYPEVTLAEARVRRDDARKALRDGIEPMEARKAVRRALEGKRPFSAVADDWLAVKIVGAGLSPKTIIRERRHCKVLNAALGDRLIDSVETADIAAILLAAEKRGQHETRSRLQVTAARIMGFAVANGWAERNPVDAVKAGAAFTEPVHTPRAAIVEPVAFGEMMRKVEACPARPKLAVPLLTLALKFLALTFVRPGEAAKARWADIDLDRGVWTMPFAALKMRTARAKQGNTEPHCVPLARQAVAILRKVREITGSGAYVFGGDRPLNTWRLNEALAAAGVASSEHVPHGFRSSASTMLNAERVMIEGRAVPRFSKDAIEVQLDHRPQGSDKIARIYNRFDYIEERTEFMQWWADKIDAMRDGAEVVPIRSAA